MLKNYKDTFNKTGYIHIKKYFTSTVVRMIRDTAETLQKMHEQPNSVLHYFEKQEKSENIILNRIEKFIEVNKNFCHFTRSSILMKPLMELADTEVKLFKEKINFKLPGGGGFQPHQDAPAFTRFVQDELFIVMIAVEATTELNGCLKVASNYFSPTLIGHERGAIDDSKLSSLQWKNIYLEQSDLFIFSSFLIHKSESNLSTSPRRCFYLTYNRNKNGDLREEYFKYKREMFPPRCERVIGQDYSAWKNNLSRSLL